MALAITAGGPKPGGSSIVRSPNSPSSVGAYTKMFSMDGWQVRRHGHEIGGQGWIQYAPLFDNHLFAESPAVTLDSASVHLPLNRHGINGHVDALGQHEARHSDGADLPVHLHFRGLGAENWGKRQGALHGFALAVGDRTAHWGR